MCYCHLPSHLSPVIFCPPGDSCKCSPPEDMKKVRKQIVDHIYPWILECQEKGHAKVPSLGSKWMFRTDTGALK
ncbi:hypothetical protein ZEAMMB73_Zm00001d047301 [Zea mays]|uniref:Uncharacterized protein n=1 Tax=Zea mays TaxID=4577 RepID=A0A1D6P8G6_MAIZE|nr:hypothetical protein ZEAMMB73_Zm00001d047301 [Zea mays]